MQVTLRPFASGFADKFTIVIPLIASPMHLRFSYQVHGESVLFMVLHYIPQNLKADGSSTASPPRGSCRSSSGDACWASQLASQLAAPSAVLHASF